MIKLVTIIGARPQFIKAAAFSRAIAEYKDEFHEVIVHTGQHYDPEMSQVFFEEMNIPRPDYNLETGSGAHGAQTAAMIVGIEEILIKESPDCVILYGDTNSTLAGAIAASKLGLRIAHIEAGLRSYNKSMPEEINRILCDQVSTFLFCPTQTAIQNLMREGFPDVISERPDMDHPAVYLSGDLMFDNTIFFRAFASTRVDVQARWGVNEGNFILATIHRNHNTDDAERLGSLIRALLAIGSRSGKKIILPMHPRTRKMLAAHPDAALMAQVESGESIQVIGPVSFLEMTALESHCAMVITDSGGVQKESYFLEKPCIVLREETEWVELIAQGTALLAGTDEARILAAYETLSAKNDMKFPPLFGDGHAAAQMVNVLRKQLSK
jgi:UDP-GlcNAc3NAcA epimerase